jgi:hypothetical protein
LPPSLTTGVLIATIFMGAEFVATLLGYVVFGAYLGLRPRI